MNEKKPPKSSPTPTAPAKTAQSAPARDTAPKPRKRAAKGLVDAPPHQCFWVNHGPVLKNLRELCDALRDGISADQFAHHVGHGRNDFANWVDHVLGEKTCAKALRRASTREAAVSAIEARLAKLA